MPGKPFEIVESTASKRKTPTSVTFTDEDRAIGLDSVMLSTSKPLQTLSYILPTLGVPLCNCSSSWLRDELLVQATLTEDSRGHIAFKVPKYAD